MKVLIAFDKFKDSMTARKACEVAARAVLSKDPAAKIVEAPLTDGGEGFCEILTRAYAGELLRHTVKGPHLEEVEAQLGYVPLESLPPEIRRFLSVPDHGRLAIVEMAQASGLERVAHAKRNPWMASTYGTGQLMRIAADEGAAAILLGIGGSATNDLGLGALEALGLSSLDELGQPITNITPEKWEHVQRLAGEACALPCVRIACDVTNPLLGQLGAASIYGPQKGLRVEDIPRIELEMERIARLLCEHCGEAESVMLEPSSGAAGGIGFGLRVACSARYVPGFELVWSWLGLDELIQTCDFLLTGEGRFDASSLQGKGPGMLLRTAVDTGKRVYVFAGRVDDNLAAVLPAGVNPNQLIEISPRDLPLGEALKQAPTLLEKAVLQAV